MCSMLGVLSIDLGKLSIIACNVLMLLSKSEVVGRGPSPYIGLKCPWVYGRCSVRKELD